MSDTAIQLAVSTGRPGCRRGARWTGVLVGVLLATVGSASARAASGAIVEVGGRSVTVTASQISAGDVPPTAYTVRTGPGQSRLLTLHGTSIRTLLSDAGVDPSTVSSVSVGGASALSPVDIADPPPFPQGPALVSIAPDGSTRYLRPVRDANDINTSDYISTAAGQPIDVVVGGAAQQVPSAGLTVTASANPTEASIGQSVSFAALAENPGGAQLNYSWSFGDGGSGFGPDPTHAYSANGDYPAAVTVSAGVGGGSGVVGTVVVHVGHPVRRTSGSGLGNSNATGSGAGGSGTGKGGTGGGNGAGGKGLTQPRASVKAAARQATPAVGSAAKTTAAAAGKGGSQIVRGILLADAGAPFDLHLSPPPPSGSAGAAHKSAGGASSGVTAVIAGLALALAIATLGGANERRRATLRPT